MSKVDFWCVLTQFFFFFLFFSFFFDLGFELFNNGFYSSKFDFLFNSSCEYLDFMFVSEDK